MTTRWAPFPNRRRPFFNEPSGAAKCPPLPPWSPGAVPRAAMGFLGFIGSMALGSFITSSLPVLVGVLRRPEELAKKAGGPDQLPRQGRRPPGSGGSLPICSYSLLHAVQLRFAQHLFVPPFGLLQIYHSVHLRPLSLRSVAKPLGPRLPLYRRSGWRDIYRKVEKGGRVLLASRHGNLPIDSARSRGSDPNSTSAVH